MIDENKTCPDCGREFDYDDLKSGDRCPSDDCPSNEDSDAICPACNGSGEGQHDGTRCYRCHGRGANRHEPEPDPDDWHDRQRCGDFD